MQLRPFQSACSTQTAAAQRSAAGVRPAARRCCLHLRCSLFEQPAEGHNERSQPRSQASFQTQQLYSLMGTETARPQVGSYNGEVRCMRCMGAAQHIVHCSAALLTGGTATCSVYVCVCVCCSCASVIFACCAFFVPAWTGSQQLAGCVGETSPRALIISIARTRITWQQCNIRLPASCSWSPRCCDSSGLVRPCSWEHSKLSGYSLRRVALRPSALHAGLEVMPGITLQLF